MSDIEAVPQGAPIEVKQPIALTRAIVKADKADRLQEIVDKTNEVNRLVLPGYVDVTVDEYINDIIDRHLEGAIVSLDMTAEQKRQQQLDNDRILKNLAKS